MQASWRLLWTRWLIWRHGVAWLRPKLNSQNLNPKKLNQNTKQSDLSLDKALALELHEIIRLAARCQYGQPACLPKSVVLYDMLSRKGYCAQLKIGVNKDQTGIASHAWVEVAGSMIGEPGSVAGDFAVLDTSYSKNKVASPKTEK